ncbi:MAG: YfcE family phosphodiesterase [Gammaproteobacteria bacterium]|nr:MAG: YfcE family phosphodiesterase [Gammaproteobacteria bacterium]
MTTRIGLVSDVHSSPLPLRQALDIFEREQVDEIICAGDIAGYYDTVAPTVELLAQANCLAVCGNHDQSYLELPPRDDDEAVRAYLQALPPTLELEIEGKRMLVVHANPPAEQYGGIRLLDQQGAVRDERRQEWTEKLDEVDCDILIVGHTHQVYALHLGDVFVINPGSSAFNHSCMILSLPDLGVREFALGGREIVKCWNFSMLYSQDGGETGSLA